jgi:hypothetical protein
VIKKNIKPQEVGEEDIKVVVEGIEGVDVIIAAKKDILLETALKAPKLTLQQATPEPAIIVVKLGISQGIAL